jgi:hypothetical protein
VTSQSNLPAIEQDLTSTLSRSFLTAWHLLGDATKAEVLVVKAIEGGEPGCMTSGSIRAAVIDRLVQVQVSRALRDAADDILRRRGQFPNEGDSKNEYEQNV